MSSERMISSSRQAEKAAAPNAAAAPEALGADRSEDKGQDKGKRGPPGEKSVGAKGKKGKDSSEGKDAGRAAQATMPPVQARPQRPVDPEKLGAVELSIGQLRDVENARAARSALIGYGYARLLGEDQLSIRFGKWNQRPLDRASVAMITKSFLEDGASPWRAPMRVLVGENDVVNFAELIKTQDSLLEQAYEAPEIRFSLSVKMKTLDIAGGNHRYHAMQEARSVIQSELNVVAKDMVAMETELKKQATLTPPHELVEARAKHVSLQQRYDQLGKWILEVYVEEKIKPEVTNSKEREKEVEVVMQWLSQNRRFYDLPETVNEKLIRMIRELAPLADESERKAFIEQQIKSAKAFTERILLDKEARDFLLVLYRVGAREWEQTKIFRASFLAKHFETGYGMVWRTAVEDMVRLVKFVFSSSAYPSIEEQQALTEAIEAGFMQQNMQSEERPVDWAKVAQRTREIEKAGLAAAAAAKLKKQERQARKKTAAAKGAASQGVEASSRSAPPRSSGGRQAKKRATEALEAGAQVKVAASKAAAPSSPKSDDGSPLESSADDDSDGSGYSPAREEVDEGSDGDEATDGDGSSGGSARPAVGFEKLTTHLVPTRQLMKWRPHPAHMKKLEAWASLIDLIDHPSALGADGQPLVSGLPALRGVWEKLDDLYADNVSPHRAYLGSMRHINGRLDDAAKKYYDTVVQEIRQLQPGELTEEEAAAWGAVAPGIEARLMLGLQTLKWIRGWQPLPCPTAMNDVGEALARTPHAIREVARWFDPLIDIRMAVSRGVHWDSSDAPYSFFHYALNIRNFCGGPVAIEDASNQMYRLILHQQIPCLFFIEWFILTHRHPGWKRPKTSAGLNELKPVLGLPVDQYILDSIPASMRKMDPSEYYQKLGDVILKTTSKDELAGAKNTTRDGAVLAQFPFIYLTRQLPFYDSTSSQRTDRRQKTTQYSLIEWAAVFSTRLPLIRQEPVQDLRTLMRGAMLKHAPAPRHPVMMFPDEEAFQSMGLFNRATMELEGNDGMYVFDETVLGSLVGAYADKCLGEISTLLSTAMRTNAGRAAMDVKGTMDGPTQRAAVAFVDALYVNVARQVSRKRFPPEYTFVSGSDPDDMGLRPSRVWPGMEDDANVLSSAIDLPGEASNLNGRVRKINPDVQAELRYVDSMVKQRREQVDKLKAELSRAESRLQHAEKCLSHAEAGAALASEHRPWAEVEQVVLGLSPPGAGAGGDVDPGASGQAAAGDRDLRSASGDGGMHLMDVDAPQGHGCNLPPASPAPLLAPSAPPGQVEMQGRGGAGEVGAADSPQYTSGDNEHRAQSRSRSLTPPTSAQPRRTVASTQDGSSDPEPQIDTLIKGTKRDRSDTGASQKSSAASPSSKPPPNKRRAGDGRASSSAALEGENTTSDKQLGEYGASPGFAEERPRPAGHGGHSGSAARNLPPRRGPARPRGAKANRAAHRSSSSSPASPVAQEDVGFSDQSFDGIR